jgi:hypothetical protein
MLIWSMEKDKNVVVLGKKKGVRGEEREDRRRPWG